jgi:hypothetical protein
LPQTARAAGRNLRRAGVFVNDKAADILDVRAAALSCPRIIRGTFPPLAEKPEREKTDATSPMIEESRKSSLSAYAAGYGLVRDK